MGTPGSKAASHSKHHAHEAEQSQHACKLHHFAHYRLENLKCLPSRARFLARYTFPFHRHRQISWLVVPSSKRLELALQDVFRFDFLGSPPTGDFTTDLVQNHDAFEVARQHDPRVRRLGKPRPLLKTMHIAAQPPPTIPPQIEVKEAESVLPGLNSTIRAETSCRRLSSSSPTVGAIPPHHPFTRPRDTPHGSTPRVQWPASGSTVVAKPQD